MIDKQFYDQQYGKWIQNVTIYHWEIIICLSNMVRWLFTGNFAVDEIAGYKK